MSLCELEATGLFGWVDIAMGMLAAAVTGGMVTGWMLKRLHRLELLAALEIGRKQGREGER